jgi:hypothetical protein
LIFYFIFINFAEREREREREQFRASISSFFLTIALSIGPFLSP